MTLNEVTAICVAAYRFNNYSFVSDGFVRGKLTSTEEPPDIVYSNKTLVAKYLGIGGEETPLLTVTEEDRTQAQEMIDAIINDNLLAILKGEQIRGFRHSLVTLLSKESVTDKELLRSINMLVYVPTSAAGIKAKQAKELKSHEFINSRWIGHIKDKVDCQITIHKAMLSQKYSCYFITAYTVENNVIRFSSQSEWIDGNSYQIRGRIKGNEINSWKGEPEYALTKLSHVKLVLDKS